MAYEQWECSMDSEPPDLATFVELVDEARQASYLTRRLPQRRRQTDAHRGRQVWAGERPRPSSSLETEQQRTQERQRERNRQAEEKVQFKAEPLDAPTSALPMATRPFNGGTKLGQLAGVRLTHTGGDPMLQDVLAKRLGPELMGLGLKARTEEEARELLADACGPRPGSGSRGDRGDMASGLVQRDVRAIVDKLERDPRIRFRLIRWAVENIVAGFPGPDEWYVPLCVYRRVDPHTGESLPPCKGDVERIARLHSGGADWATLDDVLGSIGKYQHYLRAGKQALHVAKWRTLHEEGPRWQVWVIDEEDDADYHALERPDPELLRAFERKYVADRGFRAYAPVEGGATRRAMAAAGC
jgi:hypothetical protein